MSKLYDTIFVLWGDRFEEAAAAILITELRRAGLRVKVVGLSPQPINGLHGLGLWPDLNLDQALSMADQAVCLVIPCAAPNFKRFLNDPRLAEFFERAASNEVRFVVGYFDMDKTRISGLRLPADNTLFYPRREYLVEFARRLVGLLANPPQTVGIQGGNNGQVYSSPLNKTRRCNL